MLIAAATAVATAGAVAGSMAVHARRRRERAVAAARRSEEHALVLAAEAGDTGAITERIDRLRSRLTSQLAAQEAALVEDEARLEHVEQTNGRRQEDGDTRDQTLADRAAALRERRAAIKGLTAEIAALDDRIADAVEHVAGQTRDDIIDGIGLRLEGDARIAAEKAARARELWAQDKAENEARRLMDVACQRYGTARSANRLVASVDLPRSPKNKERFLADGRALILAITEFSDVEFLAQEGKEGFYMQAPEPYTREIGRLSYERLAKKKNPTVADVQAVVEKARVDLEKICRDAGKRASRILKVRGIHPEILYLVGKLLYRTSYTQNQWMHAIETAHLCGVMAEDMGIDLTLARRSALMHDIGKVLWAETEATGSHAVSGAAFAAAHGEVPEIVHPIAAHHNDEKPSSALAHLVAAADALSGARPGARRETVESYAQRVEDVQAICADFKSRGIRNTYVISGGREVRVHVDPRRVDDLAAARLSTDIAHRIEDECIYPGQIKVMVIRETTASAVAHR